MMQAFIEYLKASGYTVGRTEDEPFAWNIHGEDWCFVDTEEEQPEVLVWCLKELELRGYWFKIGNYTVGQPYTIELNLIGEPYHKSVWFHGKTKTAAANQAVCSLPRREG